MAGLRLRTFFSVSMSFMLVVTLGTALVSASQAQAAACSSEVWVAPPPTGSDLNPGTQAAPFATIGKGVDTVCEGGTVHVAAGTYAESVDISKRLSLEGAGRNVVTVNTNSTHVFHVTADNVRISGFTVRASYSNGIALDEVSNCSIFNNTATACYYGISLWRSSNNTITSNNANSNYYDGIYLWESSSNTITSNNANDNWRDGIVLYDSDGNEISDNNVSGNLGWSCPYVYSWNGEEYKLDSQVLGNAPKAPPSLDKQRSDYDSLDYLVPSDGKHLLKLTEELDETSYVDELKLVVVEHVIGSQAVMDMDGNIYTLCSPYTPVDAVDEYGIECLDKVNAQDGLCWTSDMGNKDFSQPEALRDGIILTFDKPDDAQSARVIVNYKKTGLGAFIHVNWARIPPPQKDPVKLNQWNELHEMLNKLQLRVKDGDTWSAGTPFNDTSGSTLGRNGIAVLDISGMPGNTLTIKVESLTGLVDIDSVTVYYAECDEAATSVELSAASAVDGNGTDVTQMIRASNLDYLVLDKGDYAYLNFYYNVPVSPGYERSYFVKATGYYDFPNLTPLSPEVAKTLVNQFLALPNYPNYAYRYYLDKYYPSSGGHCGIDVAYSSNNLISGNEIYDNAYEGIYLFFSDSNRIIGNYIIGNDCGIWMECSNNNEILCNDILDNVDWSGIMIDYYYYYYYYYYDDYLSSGNAIHYNNIAGNLDYGVLNYNTAETVDATDNWWGAANGPSHSPGSGDKVSGYVDYIPWLSAEVQDKTCEDFLDGSPYTAGQTFRPGVSPPPPPRLVPPSFSVQYMNIHPLQTQVNQPVTITTNVVNSGQETGNYDVVLKINGKSEQNKMVSVGPGGTYPVKFTVTRSEPGTYTVNVDSQQARFTILNDGKTAGAPVNGGLIAILIVSLLIIVTMVLLIRTYSHST